MSMYTFVWGGVIRLGTEKERQYPERKKKSCVIHTYGDMVFMQMVGGKADIWILEELVVSAGNDLSKMEHKGTLSNDLFLES